MPISRPQPAPLVEPAGAKSVKDDITVLKEQPQTTSNANDTQRPAPSQKAKGKRPERAFHPRAIHPGIHQGLARKELGKKDGRDKDDEACTDRNGP